MPADRYKAERYEPKVPTCGLAPIRLVFDGHFLHGIGVNYSVVYPAVSGQMINGKFNYSVESQKSPESGAHSGGRILGTTVRDSRKCLVSV